MSTLYTRINKSGLLKYYGNININGKRHRKYLGSSKETAILALKKLEYDLLFQPPTQHFFITNLQTISKQKRRCLNQVILQNAYKYKISYEAMGRGRQRKRE